MNKTCVFLFHILSILVIIDAQIKKESTDGTMSMSGMDSSSMLNEPMQSMSLELDKIEMNSASDDSSALFLPKNNEKREVRAIFDLVLSIIETIRGPAKNDIRRKEK